MKLNETLTNDVVSFEQSSPERPLLINKNMSSCYFLPTERFEMKGSRVLKDKDKISPIVLYM